MLIRLKFLLVVFLLPLLSQELMAASSTVIGSTEAHRCYQES